ncbi:MAG: hypothetical protein IJ327_02855 [Lachnospiraceae bacterium]|nr:hypothetical protein [Lachnospiraceae bacterium]
MKKRLLMLLNVMLITSLLIGCGTDDTVKESTGNNKISESADVDVSEDILQEEESSPAEELTDSSVEAEESTETVDANTEEDGMEEPAQIGSHRYPEYVEPTELGNDIHSGIVELDGALYQFPIPVYILQRDGFEFTDLEKTTANGKEDYVEATLTRNGQIVISHLLIQSPFETGEVPIEDCFVSYINFIATDNPLARFPQFDSLPLSLSDVITVAEEAPYNVKKYGTKLYVFPLGEDKAGDIEIHGDDDAINTRQIIYEYFYSSSVPYGGVTVAN